MKRLIVLVAPLAIAACGAPEAPPPREPPPIVEAPRREPSPPPAPAPDEPAPESPAPPPAPPTLIDLGGTPPAAPAPPSRAAAEPPADTSADAATVRMSERLERERREKRVADAEAAIAELEKRRLAISNPYLPRPQLPPEEAQAWEGLDGVQRRQRVDRQLEEARRELEAAKKDLEALGGR